MTRGSKSYFPVKEIQITGTQISFQVEVQQRRKNQTIKILIGAHLLPRKPSRVISFMALAKIESEIGYLFAMW